MRTTVTLDPDIYEAVKVLAAAQDRSFGQVLSTLARRGLAPTARTRRGRSGFPVVVLPPDSPPVTLEAVRRALEDA